MRTYLPAVRARARAELLYVICDGNQMNCIYNTYVRPPRAYIMAWHGMHTYSKAVETLSIRPWPQLVGVAVSNMNRCILFHDGRRPAGRVWKCGMEIRMRPVS